MSSEQSKTNDEHLNHSLSDVEETVLIKDQMLCYMFSRERRQSRVRSRTVGSFYSPVCDECFYFGNFKENISSKTPTSLKDQFLNFMSQFRLLKMVVVEEFVAKDLSFLSNYTKSNISCFSVDKRSNQFCSSCCQSAALCSSQLFPSLYFGQPVVIAE